MDKQENRIREEVNNLKKEHKDRLSCCHTLRPTCVRCRINDWITRFYNDGLCLCCKKELEDLRNGTLF